MWRKENLVKYQKISKYYVHDCRMNFFVALVSCFQAVNNVTKNSISGDVGVLDPPQEQCNVF